MRKELLLLGLCCAVPAHLAAAEKKPAAPVKGAAVLARAGEVVVTSGEFVAYADRESSGQARGLKPEQRRGLLEKFVVRKAIATQGEKRASMSDRAVLEQALTAWKIEHYPDLYWEKVVDPKVKVTDDELRAMVNPQERVQLGAIVFGLDDEGHRAANEVAAKLAAGADFATMAREYSYGLAADKGGDLGWQGLPNKFVEEKQVPALREVAVGGHTAPLKTQIGWVIFQVRDRQSAEEIFRKEKAAARDELLPAKIHDARSMRLAELRKKAVITYPTKDPLGGPRPPAVVIDGFMLYEEALAKPDPQHATTSVATPKQRLEKFVDAFLLVRELERLGLHNEAKLRDGLAVERIEVLAKQALRKEVEQGLAISDAELRAEYQRYYVPAVYELQMIVTRDRGKAEQALKKVRAGADFTEAAKEYNESWLKQSAGKVAFGPLSDYPAPVRAAVEALPDGGITGIHEVSGQFMILRRQEKRTVEIPPYEQVVEKIRNRLTIRRRAELLEQYVAKFRAGLKITVDEGLLRSL